MSRGDRFDRADFSARYRETAPEAVAPAKAQLAAKVAPSRKSPVRLLTAAWPILRSKIERVGESVLTDRNGRGRPHKGIDIFADAGTEVLAANAGRVLRVIDGRAGTSATQKHAGLFVDVLGRDALVYRYLHLGEVQVAAGEEMKQGAPVGIVAAPNTSGLRAATHLHFEIRQGDFTRSAQDYGAPIDPLRLLPPLRA
jgi:murein DD-endopeptidase MepM/ murein hydrolase activator NlpD